MIEDDSGEELAAKLKEKAKMPKINIPDEDTATFSWSAVARAFPEVDEHAIPLKHIDFAGKNLEGGKFANENLSHGIFAVANLKGVDFSGANLRGADFAGADLSGANLQGANLDGAILSSSKLVGANFTKASMKGVKLVDADLQDAILLDIEIDQLGLEELQNLIEYLAKYYPHKLNLARINLTMLNLAQIDLSQVNLKGVDFTGCDMTGVNILELDLSECIISPLQIEQALGRKPSPEELAKIMAPKPKKKGRGGKYGVDFTDIFIGDKSYGVIDVTRGGIAIETILKHGKNIYSKFQKKEGPSQKEQDDKARDANKNKEELRKIIEERKKEELERRSSKKNEIQRHKESYKELKRKEFAERQATLLQRAAQEKAKVISRNSGGR
jgi:uncharacterized protein YjbI with pentapeptide repeats